MRSARIGAGFARQEAVLVLARLCRHHRLDLVGPECRGPADSSPSARPDRSAWPQPPRLTVGSSRLTVPWQLLTLRTAYQQRGFAPPYHQEDMDLGETWL
jgi:hypothetical protein